MITIHRELLQRAIRIFFSLYFRFVSMPKIDKNLEKAIGLYKSGNFAELFAFIRAWDAPYPEVEKVLPKSGNILDLGSGDGLLANYLAYSAPRRIVLGVEMNVERLRSSKVGGKNVSFKRGNALTWKISKPKAIVLAHVLHHLPSKKSQEVLINRIYKGLGKNGQLVILEISKKPFLKYCFSWVTDSVIVPVLFERRFITFDFYYRPVTEWKRILRQAGFKVSTKHVSKGMPFSHVVIVARKA